MGWRLDGEPRATLTTSAQSQRTLAAPVEFSGAGLHSGRAGRFLVSPAPVDYGIRFDVEPVGGDTQPTPFACFGDFTTSAMIGGDRIRCVEHLMSSFNGLGITNAHVQCLAGDEFPILDGSARDICSAFAAAGIERQAAPVRVLRITSAFSVSDESGQGSIHCSPAEALIVEAEFDYPNVIGRQCHSLECTPAAYADQIAGARTFLKDPLDKVPLERVRRERLLGLADPCPLIVYNQGEILSELRYPNEPARHKILDFLGDVYTIGRPVWGRFRLVRSGHQLTLGLAEVLHACRREAEADALGETSA
jgi:UDP-3-O-[3-hydroxymyristoyl] N-acetylglucosamine deacetylase